MGLSGAREEDHTRRRTGVSLSRTCMRESHRGAPADATCATCITRGGRRRQRESEAREEKLRPKNIHATRHNSYFASQQLAAALQEDAGSAHDVLWHLERICGGTAPPATAHLPRRNLGVTAAKGE